MKTVGAVLKGNHLAVHSGGTNSGAVDKKLHGLIDESL